MLESFKKNGSLKPRYQIIQNQAVVLLVSYFGSAVGDLFRVASAFAITTHKDKRVTDVTLKLPVSELIKFESTVAERIGDLLIAQDNITFQDMKSIHRKFKDYFDITIEKDENVNNIILGQACRHSIVHEGARINKKTSNQVMAAKPRSLKEALNAGETVEFMEEEIGTLSNSMLAYVRSLASQVEDYNKSSVVEEE